MNRLLGILTLSACALGARAEPPYEVDDPGVTARGTTTIYFSYRSHRARGTRQDALGALSLTYGITPKLEVGVGFDWLSSRGPDQDRASGWSDVALSLKHRLVGTPDEPDLTLGYQAVVPTGSSFATAGSVGHSLWLTGQVRVGKNRLTANAGTHCATRGAEATMFYGAVLDTEAGSNTRVGLQLSGSGPVQRRGRHDLCIALGTTVQHSERLAFQALVGRSLNDSQRWHIFLGFTLDMPGGGR